MRKIGKLVVILLIGLMPISACAESLNKELEALVAFMPPEAAPAPVSVALIDTGIETAHLDAEKVLPGENYVSETEGDLVGHGTRIASIMMGAKDGEDSLSALAPNAYFVPMVYFSKYPSGVPINGGVEAICQGIYDAIDKYNCEVIMISSGVTQPDSRLEEAVLYAEEKQVIVISAAGNEGNSTLYYPAAYPTVVGVGAVDKNKEVSGFSQRNEGVMVVAPGEDLKAVSIKNGSVFEEISGTSYACAYVGALAAQLLGQYPDMTPKAFRWLLQNTGEDLGDKGYDTDTGFGLLNMEKALGEYPALSQTTPLPFYDVFLSSWFYEAVAALYEKGFMNGTGDTAFSPDGSLTRGMLVTVLYRLEGEPIVGTGVPDGPFVDVKTDSYYAPAVTWANQTGLVNGISETEFAPEQSITREQIAAIMYRYAGYKEHDVGNDAPDASFADMEEISDYALHAVAYCCQEGLMQEKGNHQFAPGDYATRAECAAILHRFIEANRQAA